MKAHTYRIPSHRGVVPHNMYMQTNVIINICEQIYACTEHQCTYKHIHSVSVNVCTTKHAQKHTCSTHVQQVHMQTHVVHMYSRYTWKHM